MKKRNKKKPFFLSSLRFPAIAKYMRISLVPTLLPPFNTECLFLVFFVSFSFPVSIPCPVATDAEFNEHYFGGWVCVCVCESTLKRSCDLEFRWSIEHTYTFSSHSYRIAWEKDDGNRTTSSIWNGDKASVVLFAAATAAVSWSQYHVM